MNLPNRAQDPKSALKLIYILPALGFSVLHLQHFAPREVMPICVCSNNCLQNFYSNTMSYTYLSLPDKPDSLGCFSCSFCC